MASIFSSKKIIIFVLIILWEGRQELGGRDGEAGMGRQELGGTDGEAGIGREAGIKGAGIGGTGVVC